TTIPAASTATRKRSARVSISQLKRMMFLSSSEKPRFVAGISYPKPRRCSETASQKNMLRRRRRQNRPVGPHALQLSAFGQVLHPCPGRVVVPAEHVEQRNLSAWNALPFRPLGGGTMHETHVPHRNVSGPGWKVNLSRNIVDALVAPIEHPASRHALERSLDQRLLNGRTIRIFFLDELNVRIRLTMAAGDNTDPAAKL